MVERSSAQLRAARGSKTNSSSGKSEGRQARRGVPVPLLYSRLRRSHGYARSYERVGNREEAPVFLPVQPPAQIPDEPEKLSLAGIGRQLRRLVTPAFRAAQK